MIITLISSCSPKEKSKSESEYSKKEIIIDSVNPDTITEKVDRSDQTICVVNEITYEVWDMSDNMQSRSATYEIELAEGLVYTVEKLYIILRKEDNERGQINSSFESTFPTDKNNYNLYLKFSNGSIIDSQIRYMEFNDSYWEFHDNKELLKNFKESTLIKARIVNEIDGSNFDYIILESKTEILRPFIRKIEKETAKSIRHNAYACERDERAHQKEKDLEGF